MLKRKIYTKEEALKKAQHYCAYQERSHKEVKEKLFSLGIRKSEADEILSSLITENYLNEERFAIQYAIGKFKGKQWGRLKIREGLKQKQVSSYCIQKALEEIDMKSYQLILRKLAGKKWISIKGEDVNVFMKMNKTTAYLLQKGFEPGFVWKVIRELQQEEVRG